VTHAHIGPDDLHLFESPQPSLLREITGIEPEPLGDHVRLDRHTAIESTQRIALSALGATILVGFWPAELKGQAVFLYKDGRAQAMLKEAHAREWETYPSPQLAFYTSSPAQRLYMHPGVSPNEYADRWERSDGRWIGHHPRDAVRSTLWPWLKGRGFATDEDDAVLDDFLGILRNRPAHLRPGLRLRKRWRHVPDLGAQVRADINAILAAAGDATL
jgi:hypothetical protein